MKKYLFTIIISLLVGFFLSNFMIKEYDSDIMSVFKKDTTLYMIQTGVYSNIDSMKENTSNIDEYIYSIKDNLYYVYIGLTLDLENASKIQSCYKGVDSIIKKSIISDEDLINYIEKYDLVLKETNDTQTIKEITKQVIKKYKGE